MTKKPDIQELFKRTLRATEAELRAGQAKAGARRLALLGLKLANEGDIDGAKKAQREAKKFEREWRRLGGKGKIT